MALKILISHASAGVGHSKAAFAIKKAFDEMRPFGVSVDVIDSLDYMTSHFKSSYVSYYLLMIRRLANVWGAFYFFTDNFYMNAIVSRIRRYVNWLHSKRFVKFLLKTRPDVVISTHFLATEIISNLKSKGLLKARLITVLTDYRLHAFWVAKYVDIYIVGSEEARGDLAGFGISPSKVMVLGIPVEPVFARGLDKKAALERLKLRTDCLNFLIIGGGFGVGPIEEIVKILDEVGGAVQALAVCGYNDSLKKKLEALKSGLKIPLVVYGFIDNVHELMRVSDLMISKSGGLTVTEALATTLPMAILSPIPGQESKNSDFLVRNSAAIRVMSLHELKGVISGFVKDPKELNKMRGAIEKIARPKAAYDIARLACGM